MLQKEYFVVENCYLLIHIIEPIVKKKYNDYIINTWDLMLIPYKRFKFIIIVMKQEYMLYKITVKIPLL